MLRACQLWVDAALVEAGFLQPNNEHLTGSGKVVGQATEDKDSGILGCWIRAGFWGLDKLLVMHQVDQLQV